MVSRRGKDPTPSVRLVFDPRDNAGRDILNHGYEKEGYMVYGTREDSPVGHAHHYLAKRFDGQPIPGGRMRPRTAPAASTPERGGTRRRRPWPQ